MRKCTLYNCLWHKTTHIYIDTVTNKGCVELEVRVTWRYRRGHWRRQCYDARQCHYARQCYHLISDDCSLICIRSKHWMQRKTFAWKTTDLQKWKSQTMQSTERRVRCSRVSCNANWTSIFIEAKCNTKEEKLNIQRSRTKVGFFRQHVNTHRPRIDSIQVVPPLAQLHPQVPPVHNAPAVN